MVDFKKLASSGQSRTAKTLLETFNRLDRQVTHVELRPSQIKILELMDARAEARDLVVKLNTGGGKTTIGLLYLKHKLDLLRMPVVYLVPTVQLVEQVIAEGDRIGFPVRHWAQGETYPPEDALAGKAAIACTYDKFFNGRSTFARDDVRLIPGALVLDDVHAGIEAIRKCFGCVLPIEARQELVDLLASDINTADPSDWARIESDDARAVLEVPHWIYSAHLEKTREILLRHSNSRELVFAAPHLLPLLENCRLVFSGTSAFIGMDPPSVERVPHYSEAANRLFMSASIHDGAVLVRELDCDPGAASTPIELRSEATVGERMVMVPSLIDTEFSREEVIRVATAIRSVANVVVLVSSGAEAKPWGEAGATVASNDTIASEIEKLKSVSRGQFVVFVQRYDGIDLPDNACRLLIVDGLPKGESLLDKSDMQSFGGVEGLRGKIANKIEQGLGRAVRSASDYCAVLMVGRDVAGFVSRSVVLENFSPQSIRQIEIGRAISEAVKSAPDRVAGVVETIMQCLRRDEGWRDYYLDEMSTDPATASVISATADRNLQIATIERKAYAAAMRRDYASASTLLQQAANNLSTDRAWRGVMRQAASKFLQIINPVDGMQLQAAAFADNFRVSRPPVLLPVDARKITSQSEEIATWIGSFDQANGALLEIDELRSRIVFSNQPKTVEEAVRRLGCLLGAESSRPDHEFGRGPDNLWVFGDLAVVIEMKSAKTSALSKDDAEQLHLSEVWVRENVAKVATIVPIIGSNQDRADNAGDFAFGARLLAEIDFTGLVDRLRRLVSAVVTQGPLFAASAANVQRHLGPNELLPQQIVQFSREIKQKR